MLLLYKDDDIEVTMEWYPTLEAWGLHTKVKNFSPNKLKKWKKLFAEFLTYMNKQGINKFIAIPPTEKEEKWQKLFGFKDTRKTFVGCKIMEYSTWV